MAGSAPPRKQSGPIGRLRRYWPIYAVAAVIGMLAWMANGSIQDSRADGRARDAAIAARADQVSKLTSGGITVYDKSEHRYRWNSIKSVVKVKVRVGQCDIDGEFDVKVRPETSADISTLHFTVPGENQDAPSANVEVTRDSLPKLYATLRSSGLRQCIAGDNRFFIPANG